MKVLVTLQNPSEERLITIDAFDRREFESFGRKQIGLGPGPLQTVVQEKPDTYVAWLCWHHIHRDEPGVGPWPDYSKRHVDHHIFADDDDARGELPDPTRPGQSPG